MKTLKHNCETCDSSFTIGYDEEICETNPLHCPFCGEYILDTEEYDDEED